MSVYDSDGGYTLLIVVYLKFRWDEFAEAERLDEPLEDELRERWESLEITRRIDQTI